MPRPEPARTQYRQPKPAPQSQPEAAPVSEDIDLGFWVLAFVAVGAVGGLIPFWMWVFYAWFPPVR
jgi:hypothetical protein